MPEVMHSHSGDEPKPQGAFKRVDYDEETGGASAEVVPASKAAIAAAGGEPGRVEVESSDELHQLTVADLKTKADGLGVESTSGMNKNELVRAIRKAERDAGK